MNAVVAEVLPVDGSMVPAQPGSGDALMRIIERMAVDPNITPERVEAMLAVKERWDAAEARKAFVAAMAAFKAEPLEVVKRKLVEFKTRDGDVTSYRHAELADVTAVVCPAMARHGLSHAWAVDQSGPQISVTCTLTHALGHRESVTMHAPPDQSGKKNAIQQVASTVTYLQRYTLLAICGLATTGMDDDGRAGGDSDPAIDEEAEKALANWSAAIDGCADLTELNKRRAEMEAAYGGVVPSELVSAWKVKKKALSPKA